MTVPVHCLPRRSVSRPGGR